MDPGWYREAVVVRVAVEGAGKIQGIAIDNPIYQLGGGVRGRNKPAIMVLMRSNSVR